MRSTAEIKTMIARITADPRYGYKPACVETNAPLALIQVEMKAQVNALNWVLGAQGIDTSAASYPSPKTKCEECDGYGKVPKEDWTGRSSSMKTCQACNGART